MANETEKFRVLSEANPLDPKKVSHLTYPVAGEEDPLVGINKGIEQRVQELRERYDQPNWFKIAAGFAKPQLGGFTASLGSAAEAAGEGFENRRALEVPLFKMRTDLATNQALIKRNKDINEAIAKWKADPKNQGLPLPAEFATYAAQAPEASGVMSLQAQVKQGQEQQTLAAQQNQIAISKIAEERQLADKNHAMGLYSPDPVQNDAIYKSKIAELTQRASLLNSPSNTNAGYNYTPKPQTLPGSGASSGSSSAGINTNKPGGGAPGGAMADATTVSPKPSPQAGRPMPETQQEKYSHVVQLPRPQGEQSEYYNNIVRGRMNDAKIQEDRTEAQLSSYYPAIDHAVYNNYQTAMKSLREIQNNKEDQEGYKIIHNLLRKSGALATAAQEGLALHLGQFGANVSLPVTAYEQAKLPKQYWSLADRIMSNYSTIANTHMLLDGVKFEGNGPKEMQQLARYAHLGKTPDEAYRSAVDNAYDFEMRAEIAKRIPEIKARIQDEHRDELAPTTSAYRSKEIQEIRENYAKARELERQMHSHGRHQSTQKKP